MYFVCQIIIVIVQMNKSWVDDDFFFLTYMIGQCSTQCILNAKVYNVKIDLN